MTDVATLQAQLQEARAALHEIALHGGVRRLRHGLKEMEFSAPTMGALRAYINDLEGQLVALGALPVGGRPRARRIAF